MIPLHESVYNQLKNMILFQQLDAGTCLSERALAKQFLVSRTPIREALSRLEKEGLIVNNPKSGWVVQIMSFEQLSEIILIDIALVGCLCPAVIRNLTPGTVQEVNEDLHTIQRLTNAGQFWDAAIACRDMQMNLWSTADMPRTFGILKDLPFYSGFFWLWDGIEPEKHRQAILDNQNILFYLASRDADGLMHFYQNHLQTYLTWCREVYDNIQLLKGEHAAGCSAP